MKFEVKNSNSVRFKFLKIARTHYNRLETLSFSQSDLKLEESKNSYFK